MLYHYTYAIVMTYATKVLQLFLTTPLKHYNYYALCHTITT